MTTAKQLPSTITVHVPLKFTVRGGRKTIIGQVPQMAHARGFDDSIVKALARAYRWRSLIEDGSYGSIKELAEAEKFNPSYAERILKLSLLAPDIMEAILDQRAGALTVEGLAKPLPASWTEQRRVLDINA